jgi:hypothetical protein
MLTKNRFFYFWCALTGGLILITVLPGSAQLHDFVSGYDSNRWAHFLVFAAVATIPVARWRRSTNILLSLIPAFLIVALESLRAYIPGPMVRTQNIPAGLFGIAAGILLGLNIRTMRASATSLENSGASPSRPTSN